MDELEAQVRSLMDRTEILEVVAAYSTALDSRTWDLRPLFDDAMVWEYPTVVSPLHGVEEVISFMRSNLEPLDATQHFLGNHVVVLHGDEAEHSCYYGAAHIRRGLPDGELFMGAGRYEDRFRRTADGWRFTRRTLRGMWSSGNLKVIGA